MGKIQQPWNNLIPPLRGGVCRKLNEKTEARVSSVHPDRLSKINTPSRPVLEGNEWHHEASRKRVNCPSGMSRAEYTATLEEQEIESDILAYPSLELQTQLDIRKDYQELHKKIQAEGHYQCRYIEYGKDSIRWTVAFSLFVYCLYTKWYLTAAVMLGLWWVCYRPSCSSAD